MEAKKVAKKVAKTEVKAHEKRMHGMKKGGKTNVEMEKYGRNMAKVKAQRGAARSM
jgi:hypothetical protein